MFASFSFSPIARKFFTTLAALWLMVVSAHATSVLPFYESFPTNYAEGSALTVSPASTVWDSGNGAGAGAVTVASAAALSGVGGLLTSNSSRGLVLAGTPGSNRDRGASFTSQTLGVANPVVYVSFLLNVQVSASSNRLVAYLRSDTSQGTPHAGIFLDASNRLSLSKNNLTPAAPVTAALTNSQTGLVVLRYKWISAATGDDEVALWLNPGNLAVAEGLVPTATLTTTNGTDLSTLTSLMIGNRSAAGAGTATGTQWLDELRVGLTWADVTPTGGTSAPTARPVITQALLVPQGMVLRGTNGSPTGNYQVITSTNLILAVSNWPVAGNYSFDGGGNFDSTNPVQLGAAQQFFRLLTGATNPPGATAPSITNQPSSLMVAVGANANFSVGASGTAPLNYFWSFNTNTPVGGNSNSLALANVTTNDTGSYRVVVSNSVGAATSSVATLTVLIPPSITTQPTNFSVTAGGSATFNVIAVGSATLRYQWYFNTNTVVTNATNAALILNPVNATNAGTYSVVVTNSVGSVTSSVALLTVFGPPVITAQPPSQSVTVSNDATFTVTAAGTAPLAYRWFFNTNTLVGGNSNSYTRISALTNHAGTYSVIVTNGYGAVTSAFATLTVNPASAAPDFSLVGFAALNGFASNDTLQVGGTTGGAGGALVLVSNLTDLVKYLQTNTTLRVQIQSDISLSNLANHHGGFPAGYPTGEILVNSNKTIFSTNGATISRGSFRIGKASNGKQNIIIRNLKFRDLWVFDPSGNYDSYGWDYIGLEGGSHHVWVDHCDFEQVYDGMLDIVHASDYVTASWNIFRTQKKCSLISHSDSNAAEDTGHLNVTFHHNYYVDVDERMPRMRFGNAHVFNLYCENLGGNGIQSTANAATLVENSFFWHPASGSLPTREENGGPTGIVKVVSCVISNLPSVNVQFRQFGQTNFLFNAPFVGALPPYSYTNVLHPVTQTANIVTNWAGTGKLTSF